MEPGAPSLSLPEPPRLSARARSEPAEAPAQGPSAGPPHVAPDSVPAAPQAPAMRPPTPTPRPSHAGPVRHGAHGHAHAQGHAHAHAHSHAHSHAHANAHAHAHAHGCDHAHGLLGAHQHDWSHLAMAPSARRMLWLALLVQGAFLGAEVVGGIAFNSLALLGDAAHMVADVGALGLALLAASLAARPPSSRRTWGWPRAEFAAAAGNSFTLVVSCCWIAVEAVRRALHPETVHAHGLLVVAILGLGANVLGAWLLARADRENVNVRAAMAHLMLDAASSVGVIVAGVVIALGGPVAIDTVASLLIAGIAVRGTWPVLRGSLDSLLDAAPASLDGELVARTLLAAPGVRHVHDLHVWEPGPRRIAATAHVLVRPGTDVGSAIEQLQRLLRERHGIDHATLQVAHDRTAVVHWLEPRLPRDIAVRHAASLLLAGDPLLDAAIALPAVEACAAHAPSDARLSPVRLAVAGRRLLQTRQGRPA